MNPNTLKLLGYTIPGFVAGGISVYYLWEYINKPGVNTTQSVMESHPRVRMRSSLDQRVHSMALMETIKKNVNSDRPVWDVRYLDDKELARLREQAAADEASAAQKKAKAAAPPVPPS